MKQPDHYKNLDPDQKRIVVANLISQFWNKEIQDQINRFTDEQINFMTTDESKRKLDELSIAFENASSADVVEEEIEKDASNMKIKKLVQ